MGNHGAHAESGSGMRGALWALIAASVPVTGGPAFAAGLVEAPSRPVVTAPVIVPQTDWSGPYLGLGLGAAVSDGQAERTRASGPIIETDVDNGLFPGDIDDSNTAAFGGLTLGYNIQRGNLVGGLELSLSAIGQDVDFGFSRIDPEILVGVETITRYRTEIDRLATLGLRAGHARGRTLFYGMAGIARADVENSFTLDLTGAGIPQLDFSEEEGRWGYIVGLGVERRVTERISLLGEVSYYDLEDATIEARAPEIFPGNELDYTFENDGFLVKFGLNIAF